MSSRASAFGSTRLPVTGGAIPKGGGGSGCVQLPSRAASAAAIRLQYLTTTFGARGVALVYDTAIGGSDRSRVAAERLWPTIVATEQLAYRTLAAGWATERTGTPLTPNDAEQLTATIAELAAQIPP